MGRGEEVVIWLSSGAFEHRLRAALWTVTAASLGETVNLFLGGDALRLFCGGVFGQADGPAPGGPVAERASQLGLPDPSALLSQARELSPVRVVSCSTEMALAGLTDEDVKPHLDEVVSLPSFWRETKMARWMTLP
jgi:peroxiredoxin family protein